MSKKIHHVISTYKVTNHFCFLNIFHILSSYMKMIRYTILGEGGEKRCIYHQLDVLTVCSVIYMQGPGDWKCSCQAF